MKKLSTSFATAALAVACALALNACGDKGPAASGAGEAAPAAKPAAPAVPVSTVTAVRRKLELSISATGSATPVSAVDVKPQLSGVIRRVHVSEGQQVRAGDLLFTLDTRSDEANVAKLRAQIAKDQVLLADAQRQLARSRDLLAKNFISQGALDTSQTAVDSQQANLLADQASLAAAQVPLSHGQIRAASAGRVGLVPVFAGSSVQANVTTLATITRIDPIDIAFSLPQSALPDLLALLKSGQARVEARLPEQAQALEGRLQFVDSVVDAASGTVKAKARFDNREQKLWPGAFVKVSLQTRQLEDAVVVPLQAVIQSARGPVVYVAQDGKAVQKPVKLLATQGDDAAVSGVDEGDQVVVDGRQNLRPDVPISERKSAGDKTGQGDKAAKTDKAAP
ncbi:efflux RND transporter periplasmic adaptor subunit [Malikia sp.]|uniref:efflux RND transporter periplasmic adaptor subunit n=1 Tax=Malikia sp. TaxID=2070706 RepID=UPI002628459B|nr:efflux RND transporter periplasmic adaptor subunit [Malikia sp.]MDD2727771.1 efflux RND transporter periplasmic adaptor subunit [Malikia sp.]